MIKKENEFKKNSKGITLIALVITIIVLLILAGVTIATLTGENGILTKASEASRETKEAEENENTILQSYLDTINDNIPNGEGKTAKIVEDLKEGDYVNYIDKNGDTIRCMVLHDVTSGYGVQIITLDVLKEITLGVDDRWNYTASLSDYNNVVNILNNAVMNYMNTSVSSDARSVGSVPNNKSLEGEYITDYIDWLGNIRGTDDNYAYDVTSLQNLNILLCSKEYWLASRIYERSGSFAECRVRNISPENGLNSKYLDEIDISGEQGGSSNATCYLRPVFTLINETEISNGTGSKESPYELKY